MNSVNSFFYRYMNISDEWETPEKQPFKDFVSIFNYLNIDIKKHLKSCWLH